MTELVRKHHPELVDADLAAFAAGFDRATAEVVVERSVGAAPA